jgi:hypothetical protein
VPREYPVVKNFIYDVAFTQLLVFHSAGVSSPFFSFDVLLSTLSSKCCSEDFNLRLGAGGFGPCSLAVSSLTLMFVLAYELLDRRDQGKTVILSAFAPPLSPFLFN